MTLNTISIPKTISVTSEKYEKIIDICSSSQLVKKAIIKNHDDNLWWPLKVKDWRTRMIVAGLSTRVSYQAINSYQKVVNQLNEYSYEEIESMPVKKFKEIVSSIGLINARTQFLNSMIQFIRSFQHKIEYFSLDDLIYLIQKKVKGASYKVAQCSTLYAKGYYCGIMPVDSGMKDMLGPCIGFPMPKNAYGHEIFRKQLEWLTSQIDCRKIAIKNGYSSLSFPENQTSLTWWAHLVLIYYKRFYCNKHNPSNCLLQSAITGIGSACLKNRPLFGGVKAIIIEGCDGVGKTTIAKTLSKLGFIRNHFTYDKNTKNIRSRYEGLLHDIDNKRIILDRSFISEQVYGPVLRGKSRLSDNDFLDLLVLFHKHNTVVLYLKATKETLLKRNRDNIDFELNNNYFQGLSNTYKNVLHQVKKILPVIYLDTESMNPREIINKLLGMDINFDDRTPICRKLVN